MTSSQWIEVAIEVKPEDADAVSDLLQQYGHQGVVIERAGYFIETWEDEIPPVDKLEVRAYFPADASAPDKRQQVNDALKYMLGGRQVSEPKFRVLDEQDWAEAWKAHYFPFRVGRRTYICPQWIDPNTLPDRRGDDVLITLDPGMAFGTGTHPSTQLCLVAIEDLLEGRPGLQVVDLGCGSGILSIAAAKQGAAYVLGLDTDEKSVDVTLENAVVNGVGEVIHAQHGSLASLLHAARRFDVALVNILSKVIIEMCGQGLGQIVRPGGVGVFGGIIMDQAGEVEDALRQTGLEPYLRRPSGEWVVIEARRPV
ncbi:MAG: 50S ribosomal protein L11 methyltransferase [Chloroflexi bacterium]|nr:50S ribosomal protein L11 methyltransferase [Chloroflexota bacterium]